MRCLFAIALLHLLGALSAPLSAQEKLYESAYFPLRVGNKWRYRAGEHEVVVLCEKSEKTVIKGKDAKDAEIDVPVTVFHMKMSSGPSVLTETVGVLADGVYRFSAAGKEITPPLRILKLPLKVGERWSVSAMVDKTRIGGEFTSSEEKVRVPLGEFLTRTASCEDFSDGPRATSITYWFAEDVGIVKQRTRVGAGKEVVLELKSFEKGK